MAISASCTFLLIFLFTLRSVDCNGKTDGFTDQQVYIIYMGDRPKGGLSAAHHKSMLQTSLGGNRATESWLYSYTRSFNGFVAKLSEDERLRISSKCYAYVLLSRKGAAVDTQKMNEYTHMHNILKLFVDVFNNLVGLNGVVSVIPNTVHNLHTTRSWDFIGFPQNVERNQRESDMIIGVLDTGIWPESPSFRGTGFAPPPTKWKGICQHWTNFTCNNKIIGAKYYRTDRTFTPPDIASPRDTDGHGTHTASIAVGGSVPGASLYGLAAGTARGGVPSARIAVYKVCWVDGCYGSDILAAFDDAIADGVDIISVSLGQGGRIEYADDPIAIGAFHAMKNGILTSNSAGNGGPYNGIPVSNYSPWSLTVAASSIDRKFLSKVQLGNNKTFQGVALNTFTVEKYPLVSARNVPSTTFEGFESEICLPNSLDFKLVNGTILLCKFLAGGETPAAAGASGVIFYMDNFLDASDAYLIPASHLGDDDGNQVNDYINKTRNPTATIFKSTEANGTSTPYVVSFSSRGPNPITRNILKPDLTAPGVNILAAWSEANTVTGLPQDARVVPYNILSGTSMSCPHASAAAAYVKSFHPTWSPAAIKSALMTTATRARSLFNDSELAYGSGQINPVKATSPGLIYDIEEVDYINFLCGQGYTNKNLQLITGNDDVNCTVGDKFNVNDLNYPSFSLSGNMYFMSSETITGFKLNSSVGAVFHRTVTNVGSRSSTYKAAVTAAPGLSIQVHPTTLLFTSVGEKRSFVATVNATVFYNEVLSGSLVWDDGVHQVRSPVVVYFS